MTPTEKTLLAILSTLISIQLLQEAGLKQSGICLVPLSSKTARSGICLVPPPSDESAVEPQKPISPGNAGVNL
jgi:hypothetical protein